jgi:hypothetical protein
MLLRIKILLRRLGFPISFGLIDLDRAKTYKGFVMEKQAIKEVMYGGIKELMNNRHYYYRSSVSKEFSHFTTEGTEAVQSFIVDMARYITEAENKELDQRAKDMVMKELKGE